jgi:hypothetical protein
VDWESINSAAFQELSTRDQANRDLLNSTFHSHLPSVVLDGPCCFIVVRFQVFISRDSLNYSRWRPTNSMSGASHSLRQTWRVSSLRFIYICIDQSSGVLLDDARSKIFDCSQFNGTIMNLQRFNTELFIVWSKSGTFSKIPRQQRKQKISIIRVDQQQWHHNQQSLLNL